MAKVKYPLFSGDVRGDFAKIAIFRKGGIVSKYFVPRDPKTAAQLAVRFAFRDLYMAGLTRAQADLLYAAIVHLHDELYSPLDHVHDHGALEGLEDDDHSQYLNEERGNDRYSLLEHDHNSIYSLLAHLHDSNYAGIGHNHDGSYSGLSHNHSSVYSVLSHLHDDRYLQSVPQQDHGGLAGLGDDDHSQYYNTTRGDARWSVLSHLHDSNYAGLSHNHNSVYSVLSHDHAGVYAILGETLSWSTPTLINSWVVQTSGSTDVKYSKDQIGVVRLRGAVKNGTLQNTAFVLPSGYRPAQDIVFAIAMNTGTGQLVVRAAGDVQPWAGSNQWVWLDSVQFRL